MFKIADVAVGINREGSPGHSQKTGTFAAATDGNEGGDLQFRPRIRQFVGNDRTVTGMCDCRVGYIAGMHVIATTLMIRFARAHRSNDR